MRLTLVLFVVGCAFDPDPFDLEEPMPEEGAGGATAEAPSPRVPHDPRSAPETDPTEDPPGVGLPCEDSDDYETDSDHGHGNGGEGESWDPCRIYGLECQDGFCAIL